MQSANLPLSVKQKMQFFNEDTNKYRLNADKC
jgi:hypothetical protein